MNELIKANKDLLLDTFIASFSESSNIAEWERISNLID